MADEKETKKLEEFKNSEANKTAVAEGKVDEKKSKPAVAKAPKKKEEKKVELEREYVVPLRKSFLKAPRYRRAKKAVRAIKEFIAKHMRVENRDLKMVKIDINLNNEVWFRGIKKPASKIKVKATKNSDGTVDVRLAEIPEVVQFKISREIKKKAMLGKGKKTKAEEKAVEPDKDKDGVEDKIEEKEDVKAGAEKAVKMEKAAAKEQKHTARVKHEKKTMPVRQSLKK